jgi:hypothetical protein
MYPRLPSSEFLARHFGEVVKSDRVQLFAGRTLLLLGLYFVAETSTLGDEPSRLENERVMACANKLDFLPQSVFNNDVPKECREYAVDFEQTSTNDESQNTTLKIQTELPDRESFKHDYLKGPDYDDQVHDTFMFNSLGLLAASGLIYGAHAVRRGLAKVDAFRSIEIYANSHK